MASPQTNLSPEQLNLSAINAILPDLAAEVRETHWANKNLADVRKEMREQFPAMYQFVSTGENQGMNVGLLLPRRGVEVDMKKLVVIKLAHQQGFDDAHYIMARVLQDMICPEARVLVLPNDSLSQQNYFFNFEQKNRLAKGDYSPIPEIQNRAIEIVLNGEQDVDVLVSGYSKGGNDALWVPKIGSTVFNLIGVNSNELLSATGRTAKGVIKDFGRSGGWNDQRAAIAQAEIPALSEANNARRLMIAYGRFGINQFTRLSKLSLQSMTGSVDDLLREAIARMHADNTISIVSIDGSYMFDPKSISETNQSKLGAVLNLNGDLYHKHASADDPFIQARMVILGIIASGLSDAFPKLPSSISLGHR